MRVLLADDQAEVRSALRLLLEQEQGWQVVAEAAGALDLLAAVRTARPDLVLLDWELPDLQPLAFIAELNALQPRPRLVALSGRPEAERPALAAGADAFVSKGDPPGRFLAVLQGFIQGELE